MDLALPQITTALRQMPSIDSANTICRTRNVRKVNAGKPGVNLSNNLEARNL